MTSTSGPGFSLMMENLGFAVMTETPLRGRERPARRPVHGPAHDVGPGRHAPVPVRLARRLQHRRALAELGPGDVRPDGRRPSTSPNGSGCPAFLMADEIIGHMRERIDHPRRGRGRGPDRARARDPRPSRPAPAGVPGFPTFGQGPPGPRHGPHPRRAGLPGHDRPGGARGPGRAPRPEGRGGPPRDRGLRGHEPRRGGRLRLLRRALPGRGPGRAPTGPTRRSATSASGWSGRSPSHALAEFPNATAFLVPELNLGQIASEVERHTRPARHLGRRSSAGSSTRRPNSRGSWRGCGR